MCGHKSEVISENKKTTVVIVALDRQIDKGMHPHFPKKGNLGLAKNY